VSELVARARLTAPARPAIGGLLIIERNVMVYRRTWMILFSGFFEPLFYLLSIGVGLGTMVPPIDGINYTAYVAPGLLASSCMNGAISDGLFNIWWKLNVQRTYDGILGTPMRVADIAFGEMLWALSRGSLYAGAFLVVVFALGEVRGPQILLSPTAVLALPAAVVVAASLSSLAICLCSFVRKREDFDVVMGALVMPMFLFSGIFFPVTQLPGALQLFLEVVPLYHAVALLRAMTTGVIGPAVAWHLLYLIGAGSLAFVVAMRRLERALIK